MIKVIGKFFTPWKPTHKFSGILHNFVFIRVWMINFDMDKSWTEAIFMETVSRLHLKCSQSENNNLLWDKYGSGWVGVLQILPTDSSPKYCITIVEHTLLPSLIMCLDGRLLSGIREVVVQHLASELNWVTLPYKGMAKKDTNHRPVCWIQRYVCGQQCWVLLRSMCTL